MDKNLLFETVREERKLFRDGGEVLCLVLDRPQGDSVAALHFGQLIALLAQSADRLADTCAEARRLLFAGGQGYRFLPHRLRASLSLTPVGKHWKITLRLHHTAGQALLHEYALETLWSHDGALQHRPRNARRRAQTPKKKRPRLKAEGESR